MKVISESGKNIASKFDIFLMIFLVFHFNFVITLSLMYFMLKSVEYVKSILRSGYTLVPDYYSE